MPGTWLPGNPATNMPNVLEQEIQKLQDRLTKAKLPEELKEKVQGMLLRLSHIAVQGYSSEYDAVNRYIDWIAALPWYEKSADSLDLAHAKQILDANHYGLTPIKDRIIEYLAVLALNMRNAANASAVENHFAHAPILFFVGLVGTGKTTLAYSIANAMGREFVRIPFGGMGDAMQLRGQSRAHPDAEPGQVIKGLRRAGKRNVVMLLDEIDRVAEEARADIMGVLVELLDPTQNVAFIDHYIDYPLNLSDVLFIATANNTGKISTAVLDRLEPIQMPSYTDTEKIVIAKNYVLPKTIKDSGLPPDSLQFSDDVWPKIVRPLGFDAGIRTLERTIAGITRKTARMMLEGKGQKFVVTAENVNEFLPQW